MGDFCYFFRVLCSERIWEQTFITLFRWFSWRGEKWDHGLPLFNAYFSTMHETFKWSFNRGKDSGFSNYHLFFLGLEIDSEKMEIRIPIRKLQEIYAANWQFFCTEKRLRYAKCRVWLVFWILHAGLLFQAGHFVGDWSIPFVVWPNHITVYASTGAFDRTCLCGTSSL